MSCTQPIYALKLGALNPNTGKERIKILPRRIESSYRYWCEEYGEDNILQLPCGHCESCIEKRARSWAARCVLEAACYEQNCFITLTYSDNCLPSIGLCKKDVQRFIRKLRDRTGRKIRYFLAGEYGEHTYRPHYHLIIFNYFPQDGKFLKPSEHGGFLYRSKEISECWDNKGFILVGDVTYASAGYVARYCQKKLAKQGNTKEFCLMSLRPGIGESFIKQHLYDVYDTDKVYGKFGKNAFVQPFRYYDKVFESIDPERFELVKNVRITNARLSIAADMLRFGFDNVERLYKYKGVSKSIDFEKLKRRI